MLNHHMPRRMLLLKKQSLLEVGQLWKRLNHLQRNHHLRMKKFQPRNGRHLSHRRRCKRSRCCRQIAPWEVLQNHHLSSNGRNSHQTARMKPLRDRHLHIRPSRAEHLTALMKVQGRLILYQRNRIGYLPAELYSLLTNYHPHKECKTFLQGQTKLLKGPRHRTKRHQNSQSTEQ